MATALEFVIKAKNEAERTIKEVEGQVKSLESKTKDLQPAFKTMATVGVAGFGAIAGAVGLSVKSAIELESIENRLFQILKTTNGATKEQVGVLYDQALALEKVGVMSKQNIMTAQSQLATFDLQIDTINELTPAILDYVVAEKGMGASTEEVKALTNGLAQALQGNFASLTRTGFVLDDVTKELISNGTEMERAEALTDVLNSTYKDFNKTATETSEGSMILLQRSFGNISEEIGKVFLPLLIDIVKDITPIIENVSKWISENKELVKVVTLVSAGLLGIIGVVGLVGLAIGGLISAVSAIGVAFGALGTAIAVATKMSLAFIATPFGAVLAVISLAIGGLIIHLNNLSKEVGGMKNAWEVFLLETRIKLLEFVEVALNWLSKIPIVGNSVVNSLSGIRAEIDNSKKNVELLRDEFKKAGEVAVDAGTEIVDSFSEVGKEVNSISTEDFEKSMKDAMDSAVQGVREIKSEIQSVYKEISDSTKSFLERNKKEEESYYDKIVGIVIDAEDEIERLKIEKSKDITAEELANFNKKIAEQEDILKTYQSLGINLENQLMEERKRMGMNELERLTYDHNKKMEMIQREFLIDTINRLQRLQGLEDEYNKAMQYIGDEKRASIEAELEKTKTFREQLAEKTSSLGNWFKDTVAGYGNMVREVNNEIAKIVTPAPAMATGYASPTGMGYLGDYLRGGYEFGTSNVPRTGAYMLHKGEQVIPAGAGAGGGITVNITGGTYLSERVAEEIGDKIVDKIKRQIKI